MKNFDSSNEPSEIRDVTDTAFWVAAFRAEETRRPDALFRDPYAAQLAGSLGESIAERMTNSEWVRWTVSLRTVIIDDFILEFVRGGGDCVLNLGAGLDARPYRMMLPEALHWIEVDHDKMIRHKTETLAHEKPRCVLERIPMDLSDDPARRKVFAEIGSRFKKVLILTEGVIPYLSEEQVGTLARDLHAQKSFVQFISEYIAPDVYRHLNNRRRRQQMRNAPFLFTPKNWWEVFREAGWKPGTIKYLPEESMRLGRAIPLPAPIRWLRSGLALFGLTLPKKMRRFSGFVLFEKV